MPENSSIATDFLSQITAIVEKNIANEQFGVAELAHETGMSRSNLLRKVKKLTKLSVSQFIRQVRLQHAMELLKEASFNVSEISYRVGFSSTSYFIKCFRDHYGYPPGEVGKRNINEQDTTDIEQPVKKRRRIILGATTIIVVVAIVGFLFFNPLSSPQNKLDKSIAVLPFINDSNDSTNVHIINGLMESILNNLQKIEDLRVISRTSVEKYRNTGKTIPEIAKELNVNYFVEGSGQKIGDQILLNIQLIEAHDDKHLWAEQYNREAKGIFKLQMEVAKKIADEIEAIITPEEEERINKIPTDNLIAYDDYLKGVDLINKGGRNNLKEAIAYFEKAITQDNEFAHAYTGIASSYYFLDLFQAEKKYSDKINHYADKALLIDSKLDLSLIAKALFYMNSGKNELAIPYLEKALQYNPNSVWAINALSDYYANRTPDTEKYLKYALKGIRLNVGAYDSITASYTYLHISNALIQSGFVEEAEKHINQSLEYNPKNLFSVYVKAYILYAKNPNLQQLKERLIAALQQDTTRLDIIQEIGKVCYMMKDYETSYVYYKKFTDIRKAYNLKLYRGKMQKLEWYYQKWDFQKNPPTILKIIRPMPKTINPFTNT